VIRPENRLATKKTGSLSNASHKTSLLFYSVTRQLLPFSFGSCPDYHRDIPEGGTIPLMPCLQGFSVSLLVPAFLPGCIRLLKKRSSITVKFKMRPFTSCSAHRN